MKGMKGLWKKVAGVSGSVMAFFAVASIAFAQTDPVKLCDPLGTGCNQGSESFLSVLESVMGFLITDVAIPLSVIMVLVGAFQIMTAAGDPEKFSKGRKTITYAAIGLALALIAGGVPYIIKSILPNN